MTATLSRLFSLLTRGPSSHAVMLDGFLDTLLQKLENCRAGLTDAMVAARDGSAEAYVLGLYEGDVPRLLDTIRLQESHLSPKARQEYFEKIDALVRGVVVPAYLRLALPLSGKERNDFYLLPEPFHGAERIGWAVLGMLVGGFVVWAPFIPLWEKEWVLPFALAGLFFPNLRKYLSLKRYENELNSLVARTDREIARIDTAYLTDVAAVEDRVEQPIVAKSLSPARPGVVKEGERNG